MNIWLRMMLGGQFYEGENGSGSGAAGAGAGASGAAAGDKGAGAGDGTGAGAGAGAGAGDNGNGDGAAGEEAGDKGDAASNQEAAEYVDDPAKTPEENAALKTEHDAKVAADKERAEFFGAPEKYADLVVPEGLNLDQAAADGLFEMGKKLGLSQKAIDALIEIQKGVYERSAETAKTEWADTVKAWTTEVKEDKTLGGAAYEKNMGLAAAARNTFGTPEFQAWLDESQLGSHPEMVRFMVQVGQAMGEGSTLKGGKIVETTDVGELLYDNPTSKVT